MFIITYFDNHEDTEKYQRCETKESLDASLPLLTTDGSVEDIHVYKTEEVSFKIVAEIESI